MGGGVLPPHFGQKKAGRFTSVCLFYAPAFFQQRLHIWIGLPTRENTGYLRKSFLFIFAVTLHPYDFSSILSAYMIEKKLSIGFSPIGHIVCVECANLVLRKYRQAMRPPCQYLFRHNSLSFQFIIRLVTEM